MNLAELLREVEEDRDVIHVPLRREEESIDISAGAYLVGKKMRCDHAKRTIFSTAIMPS
jgi:sulfopyruvate decarboxylase TPP-binding subunit